jgi:hypothetical protein
MKGDRMAVAVVQDWVEEETDRSTNSYDAISERLRANEDFAGLIVHTAGFTGKGFRIFEVWESREAFERFVEERLMPLVNEVSGPDAKPPELTVYELHGLVVAPQ